MLLPSREKNSKTENRITTTTTTKSCWKGLFYIAPELRSMGSRYGLNLRILQWLHLTTVGRLLYGGVGNWKLRKRVWIAICQIFSGEEWAVLDANQRDVLEPLKHTMKQLQLPPCTSPVLVRRTFHRTFPRHEITRDKSKCSAVVLKEKIK